MRAVPGIILQARVASHRLPGKALQYVGGRTVLEQCLRRLKASGLPRVVLATTERPDDDALETIAAGLGIPVYRGSENDVLDRFVRCASYFDIDPVIRATGDNPAVDIDAAGRLLTALKETRADYVMEEGLPYGAAVEAVKASALGVAALLARDPFDREHVTTFVRRRHDLFRILALKAPEALFHPGVKVTVDTLEDLHHVRELYARASGDMPSLADLIAVSTDCSQSEVA
jgi:spore coat polysaccharide biosynthesis protein SpsF (cytidylyltransferase family)